MLETLDESCPYCGEIFETLVDFSAGEQDYYEDCPVCCQPIFYRIVYTAAQELSVEIYRDDE